MNDSSRASDFIVMKLTIHDNPELLTVRLRTLKKLKTTEVKVGLPLSAVGRLHFILADHAPSEPPGDSPGAGQRRNPR